MIPLTYSRWQFFRRLQECVRLQVLQSHGQEFFRANVLLDKVMADFTQKSSLWVGDARMESNLLILSNVRATEGKFLSFWVPSFFRILYSATHVLTLILEHKLRGQCSCLILVLRFLWREPTRSGIGGRLALVTFDSFRKHAWQINIGFKYVQPHLFFIFLCFFRIDCIQNVTCYPLLSFLHKEAASLKWKGVPL